MSNIVKKRILVAGAGGAVGRRLCPLLIADGWHVIGTTRSIEKAKDLRAIGVEPAIVDVYDEKALNTVVASAQAKIIIHQLTDLPPALDPAKMPEARIRNARIRDIGTRNVIASAVANGVERMVVQSIAFAYAPGATPYHEDSPISIDSIAQFERQVLNAPFLGIILRYGKFYGPGTGFDNPPSDGPLHVDAAADAARRAVTRGMAGVYNIAENDGTISSQKAIVELGWNPDFRLPNNLNHNHNK